MVVPIPNNLICFGHTAGIVQDIQYVPLSMVVQHWQMKQTQVRQWRQSIETIGTKATILAVGAEDGAGAFL